MGAQFCSPSDGVVMQFLASSDIDVDGLAKISLQSSSSHPMQAKRVIPSSEMSSWPLARLIEHFELQDRNIQDLPSSRLVKDRGGVVHRLHSFRKPNSKTSQEKLRAHVARLQALQSEGFARIMEIYEDSRSMALVMENCSGGTVQERILQRQSFSEQECAVLIKHMLQCLHELQNVGLAHGHLSPESFRFASDQTQAPLKMVDFGLELKVLLSDIEDDSGHGDLLATGEAKVHDWPRTSCPQLFETCRLVFCAPEVLKYIKVGPNDADLPAAPCSMALQQGSRPESLEMLDLHLLSEAIDTHLARHQDFGFEFLAQSDSWSVGAVAFLLLCGYPPFFAPCRHSIISRVEKIDLSFDPPFWSKISEEAKDFVQRCLHGAANQRLRVGEALQHPWIQSLADTSPCGSMLASFALNLRRFCRTWLIEAFVANSLASKLTYANTLELQIQCQQADADRSGFLTSADLRQVLQSCGHADIVEAIGSCFARFLRHPGESYLDYHALLDSVRLRRELLLEEEMWARITEGQPMSSFRKILQREGLQDVGALGFLDEPHAEKADFIGLVSKSLHQLRLSAAAAMQRSLSKE